MRTLLSGILFALLIVPVQAQETAAHLRKVFLDPQSKTVLVAAHRASHRNFPENSIPAIRHAIQTGVDIIEIDVKTSVDGIPFLMHDRTINRTTNGKGDPEKMTWETLKSFSLLFDGKPSAERIPTLEEALLVAKGKILIDLDMKTDDVKAVIDVIKKTGTQDYVFIFDGDEAALKQVRELSNLLIMPRASDIVTARQVLGTFSPAVVHIDPTFNNAQTCELIRSNNARIWINALGETDKAIAEGKGKNNLEELLAHGANIIQTDEPQLLRGLLYEAGKRPDIAVSAQTDKKMQYAAHRSKWRRRAPENTIASMQEALRRGANFLEIDVRTTRDGEIVILHDGSLDRTTNLKGAVKDFTLEELKTAKVKRSETNGLPTLNDVVKLVSEWNSKSATPAWLYVDCKDADPAQLLGILKKSDMLRHSVFYGSDDKLSRIRQIEPETKIMPALRSAADLPQKAAQLRPYAFDVAWSELDQQLVNSIHAYDIKVFSDVLALKDRRKNYRKAAKMGVDVIQTDRLKQAIK